MSLGILVGRFGTFVREQHDAMPTPVAEKPFPDDLVHLRETVGHHLIPLTILARADGDYADVEQEAIVSHCLSLVRAAGLNADDAHAMMLKEYICDYRPARTQLDLALHRLARGTPDEVAALLAAAQAVVDADGQRRAEEVKLLDELLEELAKL
jgi:hypothetical protein